jgi:hypothetical protein
MARSAGVKGLEGIGIRLTQHAGRASLMPAPDAGILAAANYFEFRLTGIVEDGKIISSARVLPTPLVSYRERHLWRLTGAPKSSEPATHPASAERRFLYPEHGSLPPSYPNTPCLKMAFCSIWGIHASSSHRQREVTAVLGTQNRACRECRGGSTPSPEYQPGSDAPGAAIPLTDSLEIGPAPSPWSESPERPYPSQTSSPGSATGTLPPISL